MERDWGHYGNTPLKTRKEMFAETERLKAISSFMTRYDGGENIPDVAIRVKLWIDTINRELTNRKVLAVAHGELMWAARYLFEGMIPPQWEAMDEDKTLRIGNCCMLHYSRQNPENPEEVSRTISGGWRRMTDPFEPENSPYGGEWVKMPGRTRFIGREMLAAAEAYPRLPDEELPDMA
jgi:broad specificity phosphatase PhoE